MMQFWFIFYSPLNTIYKRCMPCIRIVDTGPLKYNPRFVLLSCILVFWSVPVFSQQFSISGTVLDEETGAPIEGAHVFISNTMLGTITDKAGFYRLSDISLGTHTLAVSVLGYETLYQRTSIHQKR